MKVTLDGYGTSWTLVDLEGFDVIRSHRYTRGSKSYGRPSPQYGYRLECQLCDWTERVNGQKPEAVSAGRDHAATH